MLESDETPPDEDWLFLFGGLGMFYGVTFEVEEPEEDEEE